MVYADVSVEPTDASFADAIRFAEQGEFDGFVAVGGGSVMDTAKAANLYDTYPAEFLEYVNAPIGKGTPVPGALKPLIAVPTTAGTGSETSGVAIFDMKEMHAKTGIANRALKPHMGLVDPENTRSMPRNVAAFSGFRCVMSWIGVVHRVAIYAARGTDRSSASPGVSGVESDE